MKNDFISKNVKNIELSGIRKFFNKVSQYPEALSLTLGQPDFKVPEGIKKAMISAIEHDRTGYTSNAGIIELREEICNYLKGFDIEYSSDEVCLTIGGSEGILATFMAILNEGDKVLVPSIAYPAYESCIKLVGGTVVNYNLKEDLSIDIDNLELLIRKERPKVLVLSFPSNPTGAVLSKVQRDLLYKIIATEEILVLTDEIYSALSFKEEYYSIAQRRDIKDKIIYISGFSKMFSMTGLRLGYICAPKCFMENIIKVHQYNVSCAPSIVQWGAYEGIKNCLDDVKVMKEAFKKRRDYVYNRLISMGFDVIYPQGAFYIFPSIKKFNLKSEEFCNKLLSEGKVAVVPGSAFGEGGEGYIRISYSYSMEVLIEALDRIEKWIKEKRS